MKNINQYNDDELLAAYTSARREGKSLSQFAVAVGITVNSLRWRLYTIRQKQAEKEASGDVDKLPDLIKRSGDDDSNYTEIESTDVRIKTLEQLIAAAKIDLNVWDVERWVVNKWEVGAKTARRRIKWENGQIIDGELDDPGKLTVEPLYQIKAWLIRKTPVSVSPVISPITIRSTAIKTLPKLTSGNSRQIHRALIVPDLQFGFSRDIRTARLDPFHDRRAIDIALQIAEKIKPDRIIFLGDALDLPDWSDKYLRTPEFYFNTQPAVVELAWWFAQFRAVVPDAEIDLIEGNHELRMINALRAHLNAAYALKPANEIDLPPSLSVPKLLDLESLRITYHPDYPNNDVWISPYVIASHGQYVRSAPGETAKYIAQVSDVSVVFGHIHRIERASRSFVTRNGKRRISAVSPGALCRLDLVVPGDKNSNNWQQGLAVVYYDPGSDYHSIETVEITDGFSIYAGETFFARDHIEKISYETGWNFR